MVSSDIAKNRLTMVQMAVLRGNHYAIKERLVLVDGERQGRQRWKYLFALFVDVLSNCCFDFKKYVKL